MKLISIDPGESVGVVYEIDNQVYGRTIRGESRLTELWNLLNEIKPDKVIYEQFALRQSAATKLVGSKFITCEVIGVIKLYCELSKIKPISLIPVNKEYCGFSSNPKNAQYGNIKIVDHKITEHTRDAMRLLSYAKLFEVTK